jgi:hypothetical protein
MPGSLARPPQHEHRDKGEEMELTGELTEERDRGPWRRHVGAATVVAGRPPSRGCNGKGVASCSRPSGRAQHQEARAKAPARPAGADQAVRARSTGRSSEAMAMIGGKVDESPWSEGSTRQGGAVAP